MTLPHPQEVVTFPHPEIFVSSILNKKLLYAPLQQTAVLLSSSQSKPPFPALLKTLQTLSVIPTTAPLLPSGPLIPPFLGILPTRGCNLACTYCGFFAPEQKGKLSLTAAASAVRWYVDNLQETGRTAGEIHFFGC